LARHLIASSIANSEKNAKLKERLGGKK